MVKKKIKKGRYNFLISEEIYSDFALICDELGLIRSKKVEHFMQDFIDEHKTLLKKLKEDD